MVITGWLHELTRWLMKLREKFSHLRQVYCLYSDNISQRTQLLYQWAAVLLIAEVTGVLLINSS